KQHNGSFGTDLVTFNVGRCRGRHLSWQLLLQTFAPHQFEDVCPSPYDGSSVEWVSNLEALRFRGRHLTIKPRRALCSRYNEEYLARTFYLCPLNNWVHY
ncbi:hypothetical protein AVEN_262507-1, partial [Araneus ventricosus]